MSLQFVFPEFLECPPCLAKPGSPSLCSECLERRELHGVLKMMRLITLPKFAAQAISICKTCTGIPKPHCKEHGR